MNNLTYSKNMNIPDENIVKLNNDEKRFVNEYVSKMYKFDTIFKYFYIHMENSEKIFDFLNRENKETLFKKTTRINTLFINYISSAKILVDLLEDFDRNRKKDFHMFVSQVYDVNFEYMAFMTLRNFSQHGHYPLYFNGKEYTININYILEIGKDFNFSKSARKKLSDYIKNRNDIVEIPVKDGVIGFQEKVFNIYKYFYDFYKEKLFELFDKFAQIVNSNKEKILFNYNFNTPLLYFEINERIEAVYIFEDKKEFNFRKDVLLNSIKDLKEKHTCTSQTIP